MLRDKITARFLNNAEMQKDEDMRNMMRNIIRADGTQKETVSMWQTITKTFNGYLAGAHLLYGKSYIPTQLEVKQESLQQQSLKLQITDGFLEGKNENLKEFTALYLNQELEDTQRGVFANVCDFWSNRITDLFTLIAPQHPPSSEHEVESEPEEVF